MNDLDDVEDEPDEILLDFLDPEQAAWQSLPRGMQPAIPQPAVAAKGEEWLTTREVYERLTSQGFQKSLSTFRRWLKDAVATGVLPLELECMELEADFEARRRANPRNSNVRWLRCRQR